MKKYALLLMLLIVATVANGQSGTEIRGRVTDERNANVAGAQVRLRSRAGGELSAATDGNGTYAFKDVVPGNYLLEIKAQGFCVVRIADGRHQRTIVDQGRESFNRSDQ